MPKEDAARNLLVSHPILLSYSNFPNSFSPLYLFVVKRGMFRVRYKKMNGLVDPMLDIGWESPVNFLESLGGS